MRVVGGSLRDVIQNIALCVTRNMENIALVFADHAGKVATGAC